MKRQQGKLLFEQKANGVYEVTLFRKTDKGKSVLTNFQNAESCRHLHDKDCEYIKINKQIEIYVEDFKNGKSPLYNSTKPANTPTYQKKPEAILKTKEVEIPISRRSLQENGNQEQKTKNPMTGDNLFKHNTPIEYTRLPKDTRESLNLNEVDNNALLINKLVHFYKFNSSRIDLTDTNNGDAVLFRNNIVIVDNSNNKWHYKLPIDFKKSDNDKIIQSVNERQKKLKEKWGLVSKIFTLNGRLIIGLGGGSVYETDITLHHIYGFPYIPASAVKGVLRSWVLINCFNGLEDKKAEEKAFECENFKNLFGTQDQAGKVTFFDAFPTQPPKIEVDVMTPHYGDYYGDKENKKNISPTDTMSPNPIPFLTVADTPFQFLFGSKDFDVKQKLWSFSEGEEGKTLAEWLKHALQNHGIGAKTAVGYGYFKEQ